MKADQSLHQKQVERNRQLLRQHAKRVRLNLVWERLVWGLILSSIAMFFYLIALLADKNSFVVSFLTVFYTILMASFLFVLFKWFFQWLTQFTVENCADMLNRLHPSLEHSCQLLLKDANELNALQTLQYQKVMAEFLSLAEAKKLGMPETHLVKPYSILAVCLLVCGVTWWWGQIDFQTDALPVSTNELNQFQPMSIEWLNVMVTPPEYTLQNVTAQQQGDLQLLAGSQVKWQLKLSGDQCYFDCDLHLKLENQKLPLLRLDDNTWTLEQVITHTSTYQFLIGPQPVSDVFTIEALQDQAPKVRILQPKQRLVELSLNDRPILQTEALVSDDFGLSKVVLLTSVAKGSGEAVKFRDLDIEFDRMKRTEQGDIYQKLWDFKKLGMEPGDELYFTVVAEDNKQPDAQQGRSNTIIVRWHDEEQQAVAAAGLLLNYELEYFRSQRQIIIETEQLIADRAGLSQAQIDEHSVSLGLSQSDLKQRYGQYLGDEFGEGPGAQAALIGGHSDVSDALRQGAKQHEHHQHNHHDHHDHGHDDSNESHSQSSLPTNMGDRDAVLNDFVHTHEEVHVGEVSSQNPKAMMKKAVGYMWQAELHLMLSDPETALPFELEAYKYLKLAKQAERIYVKRLGFEPPPVSEDKRLTGDLAGVSSYQLKWKNFNKQPDASASDTVVFRHCFTVVNQWPEMRLMGGSQQAVMNLCQQRLTQLAQKRSGVIQFAAIVQQMLANNRLNYDGCGDCLARLQGKLWQLVDANDVGAIRREGITDESQPKQRSQP